MTFFSVTTQWLLNRLKRADKGWEKAILHPKYRDEPLEDKAFTPAEHVRMFWAESWRCEFHWIESELYKQPEIRSGLCEGVSTREPMTIYTT